LIRVTHLIERIKDPTHRALIVDPADRLLRLIWDRNGVRKLREQPSISTERAIRITDCVVGHCEEPREEGLSMKLNLLTSAPGLKEDNGC
jgi:hypothetical protein